MKMSYRLNNLGCANCAAKMERAIQKIAGVNKASVNFMTRKLNIEADDARFDEIMGQAAAIVKKIEPDCIIQM